MAQGVGYYEAYETGVGETWGGKPGSVLAVRLPTFFWFWSRLPRAGIALVVAYLALSSAAVVAATYIARRFVRTPFALVGAAAVASHALSRAISRDITYIEPWVGAIVVICSPVRTARPRCTGQEARSCGGRGLGDAGRADPRTRGVRARCGPDSILLPSPRLSCQTHRLLGRRDRVCGHRIRAPLQQCRADHRQQPGPLALARRQSGQRVAGPDLRGGLPVHRKRARTVVRDRDDGLLRRAGGEPRRTEVTRPP